jgi:hypothetical protein
VAPASPPSARATARAGDRQAFTRLDGVPDDVAAAARSALPAAQACAT